MGALERCWYSWNAVSIMLWPLSLLYCSVAVMRRRAFRSGLLRRHRLPAPVIVVGNICVGGTGKTPLVARLVETLRDAGYSPGIVSRGFGGRSKRWPRRVNESSDPREVGDEPVLLADRGLCPVWVSPNRVEAARSLLASGDCDVVVCDDGMQHYRLERDIEIAVIDGHRRFGNGACLPAGPLRESPERLREVDFVVTNGMEREGEYLMTLEGDQAICLTDPRVSRALSDFTDERLHAVAGIGNPDRFFNSLRNRGLRVIEHVFPDHHDFQPDELEFGDGLPVLMTEKDAVKCRSFARDGLWYVPVRACPDPELERKLLARLKRSRLRSVN